MKAMKEIKQFAASRLAGMFGGLTIAEKLSYDEDEDLVISKFLSDSTYRYNKKGRKFSMMYGKLFKEEIEKNHLKYMNELVVWLLDEGCNVRHMQVWSGYSRVDWLVAELKKDKINRL
ncbi:hypothetical protein PQ478_09100 [Alkalihalophilus pseudofirmus]|uniref:hypothetical protein n=1 Tax=Alkalihalophilus pseudofirmus TaxID=79885 RepID=UPI00259B2AB9|nr:hypothetical protein [Alkalihalophilus pseudofirmus]WEG18628.1 hypothetical protein PQ478_09100 [Alkalihalophilus pseudofirmus]